MTLYPTIGHKGMEVLSFVSRSGKVNRSGRFVRIGCLPDINPLLCSWFALAALLLFRWEVEKEAPPNWGDGEHATLFDTPLLRSPQAREKPMPPESHSNLCGGLLRFFGVISTKATHFFRGNTARVLELWNVPPPQVEKFLKTVNSIIANSYGTGQPVEPMLVGSPLLVCLSLFYKVPLNLAFEFVSALANFHLAGKLRETHERPQIR